MKTVVTLLFVTLFNCILFSQIVNSDKIIEFYGEESVAKWMNDDPSLLTLVDKYISYGFMVKTISEGKYSEFTPLESVPLSAKEGGAVSVTEFLEDFQSTNFNPLKYKFFPTKDFQVFKLKDVNRIIYILPQETILLKN